MEPDLSKFYKTFGIDKLVDFYLKYNIVNKVSQTWIINIKTLV